MADEQTVKDSLLELRASLAEKYTHAKLEVADLEQQIGAIDLLITKQFDGDKQNVLTVEQETSDAKDISKETKLTVNSENGQNGNQPRPKSGKVKRFHKTREGSVRDTARKYFNELPKLYTKRDVANLVEIHHPSLKGKKVNENSLLGIVRDLVGRKMAKVKVDSSGTAPKIYEKLV